MPRQERKKKAGLPRRKCSLAQMLRVRRRQRRLLTLVAMKNPPEVGAPGGSLLSHQSQSAYAFIAPFTASAVIGSERTRAPQALKIALASAGATTVTAGSPTPVAFSPLAMTLMATSGTWDIRSGM